jgi:predicted nucleic acid-binding protein
MIGVADTSPISALLRINRLTLFTDLFESALIPAEVAVELDQGKHILGDWLLPRGVAVVGTHAKQP